MLNPTPSQCVNRPSAVERKVLCSRYSECLEICLSKGWPGFSCAQCQDFDLECPDDAAHWAEQSENSGCLLMSAGYFPKWIIERIGNQNRMEEFVRDL